MGGRGSGRWYRWSTKPTVEGYIAIDVRKWHRQHVFRPGLWFIVEWSQDGEVTNSIGVETLIDQVELQYQAKARDGEQTTVKERVDLQWTECNYGGQRPWFSCPGFLTSRACGRRVAKLYCAGRLFLCRHCYSLTYQSCNDAAENRTLHQAQNIRRRLGGSPSDAAPFPDKPKGMHWRTYMRLMQAYDDYDMLSLRLAATRFGKFDAGLMGG